MSCSRAGQQESAIVDSFSPRQNVKAHPSCTYQPVLRCPASYTACELVCYEVRPIITTCRHKGVKRHVEFRELLTNSHCKEDGLYCDRDCIDGCVVPLVLVATNLLRSPVASIHGLDHFSHCLGTTGTAQIELRTMIARLTIR